MYPKKHKKIVTELMDGKFITQDDPHFQILKDHKEFYVRFFDRSFGYALQSTPEYHYLLSPDTQESTSRDISIFFSVLCYELDQEGRNFMDVLNFSDLHIDEITDLFRNTTWRDQVQANKQLNSPESLRRLIHSTMVRRNIAVKLPDDRYAFTAAYKYFIDYARELVRPDGEEEEE